MIVWIAPMDCKNVFDLFPNLIEEDPATDNTKELTDKEKYRRWLENILFITGLIIGLYAWYKGTYGNGPGPDIGSTGGTVNIADDISVKSDSSSSSSEISLLSEKYNTQPSKDSAGPIISKHW